MADRWQFCGGRPSTLLVLCGVLQALVACAYTPPRKFLVVTNANNGTVSYGLISEKGHIPTIHTLVEDGLSHPQGVAIDQKRQLLIIADSGLRKVVAYGLTTSGDRLSVDAQTTVAEEVEARWVAVDGLGNVFFTDEVGNKIMQVPAKGVLDGITTPTVLFDETTTHITSPGGVATDNFHVYWTNKAQTNTAGTVVKAPQWPTTAANSASAAPKAVTTNSPKSYGVCVAGDTIFYTNDETNVYGVSKSTGGDPVTMSTGFSRPRGCTWDGGSNIYVADRSANAVFSFPALAFSLAEATPVKVADVDAAFGVGVFSSAPPRRTLLAVLPLLFCSAIASALRAAI